MGEGEGGYVPEVVGDALIQVVHLQVRVGHVGDRLRGNPEGGGYDERVG